MEGVSLGSKLPDGREAATVRIDYKENGAILPQAPPISQIKPKDHVLIQQDVINPYLVQELS